MENLYISNFINIIISNNNNDFDKWTSETLHNIYYILVNNLLNIMIHLDDIDNELAKNKISIFIRIDIYDHLFNDDIYDKIYNKCLNITENNYKMEEDEYLKYLLYCILVCEIIKKNLYDILVKIPINNSNSNSDIDILVKNSLIDLFKDKTTQSNLVINKNYKRLIKLLDQDCDLLKETNYLISNNNIIIN